MPDFKTFAIQYLKVARNIVLGLIGIFLLFTLPMYLTKYDFSFPDFISKPILTGIYNIIMMFY